MNKYEQGTKRLKEILGNDAPVNVNQKIGATAPDFARYVVEFVYGELYSRPCLTDKSKELAAVACLIGQGNNGLPLRAHFKGMLNVGWKHEEIVELLTFLSTYAGFPKIVDAVIVLQELIKEMNDFPVANAI